MKRKIELLAPGGDVDSIKAAIIAGADAVYCGLENFNARNRAINITFEELVGLLRFAHKNDCKLFLTINIIILEKEISAIINLLNKLVNTDIDGVIVQDFGLFYLISKYFKTLEVHASTQLTTHNRGQIEFLNKLNADRVNLSRELSIKEISYLTAVSHKNNISTEVFVHGSNCLSFSGVCYMSSVTSGSSGNRGRCSQPCREKYVKTPMGKNFPLNIKDKSAFFDLKELHDAGVDSLKIEGRIKKFHYVYTVVYTWRKQLNSFYYKNILNTDNSELYKVFNRDFSNDFLRGNISKNMFIDTPRDHSAKYLSEKKSCSSEEGLEMAKKELYDEKTGIITRVRDKINNINIEKLPITIKLSGKLNELLLISIKTHENSFVVKSKTNLVNTNDSFLNYSILEKKFNFLNNFEYYVDKLDLDNLDSSLFIPFREFDLMKKDILFLLNDSKKVFSPIEIQKLVKNKNLEIKPKLSILISSTKDLYLSEITSSEVFFQLPDSLGERYSEFVNIFLENKKIIPWFPSILIGEDYNSAVNFLDDIKPKLIVTNNTGIAYEAYKRGLNWIAGPYINIVNSYSLLSLKENFNCYGSFISNEISKKQIRVIKNPENVKLYYSIYHPILVLTTRQCLFHQVTGCEKTIMNNECIKNCGRSTSITNLKGNSLLIKKTAGNHHKIFNENNFLNLDIISDLPNIFSNFFIDLSDVKTQTTLKVNKEEIIKLFEALLEGNMNVMSDIKEVISFTINEQYKKGL